MKVLCMMVSAQCAIVFAITTLLKNGCHIDFCGLLIHIEKRQTSKETK